MILWNSIWHRGRIYFTAITLRERPISWRHFIFAELQNSHKGSRDKDMIQFGKDESHIRMMVKMR